MQFKNLSLSFFLFFSGILFGQRYPDSIKQALKAFPADTAQVMNFVYLADYYSNLNNFDSALYFLDQAKPKADPVNDKTFLALVYYQKGITLQYAGNYAEAIQSFYKALAIYLRLNRISKLGDTYNYIGTTFYYQGTYDSAIVNFNTAAVYALKDKDNLLAARCYNNMGIMYDIKGDRVKSIENYLAAVKIYEKEKREDLNTGPYQNIALVYLSHKQYDEAIKNLEKAKGIALKYKDERVLCRIYNSIATVYDEQGKYEEANKIFNEALALAEKVNDNSLKAICLTNLGENCLYLENYIEGERILKECVAIKKGLENKVSLGISEIALAQAYIKNLKFTEAIESYNSGLAKVREAGYKEYQKTALEGLAASYAGLGKYREAYSNLNEFVKINDTLLNESTKKIVSELQTKYDTEKKDSEIKLLSKEKELQSEELKRKRVAINFSIGVGVLIFILLVVVFMSLRSKKKANIELAEKNNEIKLQRDQVQIQKEIVDEKQKEIVDSINYAKRLQDAILPPLHLVRKYLPETFIYYRPKDIVAGDFYWFHHSGKENDPVFMAVADCTGHGVPGAMVSVVCSNALNRSVKEFGLTDPGKILDKTRELVLETFSVSDKDVKDGMDISLISLKYQRSKVSRSGNTTAAPNSDTSNSDTISVNWSGANNPLWFISDGVLHEIKADKQPIGKSEDVKPFTSHTISLKPGDSLYLFSDGYADQFGGPKGKKFKYKALKELLEFNSGLLPAAQEELLAKEFESWRGNLEQVDDVCILGIRI